MNKKLIIWIFVMFCLINSVMAITDLDIYNNTVLIWTGNNGLEDTSAYATNISLGIGNPTQVSGCHIGDCYEFDGNDALNVQSNRIFPSKDYLFCFWGNLSQDTADGSNWMGQNAGDASDYMLWRSYSTSRASRNFMQMESPSPTVIFAEGTDVRGSWTHICFAANTTHILFYQNGSRVDTIVSTDTTNTNEAVFALGSQYEAGYAGYMKGWIDEFYIFNDSFAGSLGTDAVVTYLYGKNTSLGNSTTSSLTVSLISPPDNATNNSGDISFKYNYTGIDGAECSLYTNETGSWAIRETNSSPLENVTSNFVHTVSIDGEMVWNVGCNNTFADTNFSLNISLIQTINLTNFNLTSNDSIYNNNWDTNPRTNASTLNLTPSISFNTSLVDLNCTLYNQDLNYSAMISAGSDNCTSTGNIYSCSVSPTNAFAIGNHNLYVSCTGSGVVEGSTSDSEALPIRIRSRPTQPNLTFPINNSFFIRNGSSFWTWLNWTNSSGEDNDSISFYIYVNGDLITHNCYQEFANGSTKCGGLATGSYNHYQGTFIDTPFSGMIDGSYSTDAEIGVPNGGNDILVNFSYGTPLGLNSAKWQTKDGLLSGATINTSISPLCLEQNPLRLQLEVGVLAPLLINWSCFNGTDNELLLSTNNGFNDQIWEEGIHWNLSTTNNLYYNLSPPKNVSDYNFTIIASNGDYNSTQEFYFFSVGGLVNLSNYNMTSNGGCISWNTDKTVACNTSDTTPTVTFDTDTDAFCAISDLNYNYTNVTTEDANRNCSTTGSTNHICTMIAGDARPYNESNLYISCKTTSGIENSTSSSSRLRVQTYSIPTTPTLVLPLNNTNIFVNMSDNTVQLNWTTSTSADGKTISYRIYINGTASATSSNNYSNVGVDYVERNYSWIVEPYTSYTSGVNSTEWIFYAEQRLPDINSLSLLSKDSKNLTYYDIYGNISYSNDKTFIYKWYNNSIIVYENVLWDNVTYYYPFDISSNDYKSNLDANTETEITYSEVGIINYSIDFDSNTDNLTYPQTDFGSNFTISIWMKPGITYVNDIKTVMANSPSGGSNSGFRLYLNSYGTSDRKIYFETSDGASNNAASTTADAFKFGEWTHILVKVNKTGSKAQIYVNGIDKTSDSSIHNNFSVDSDWTLSRMEDDLFVYAGQMDELQIYKYIVSDNELEKILFGSKWGGSELDYSLINVNENWTIGVTPLAINNIGNETNSSITINYWNQTPQISFVSPDNGSVVSSSTPVIYRVEDDQGVNNCSFYIDGVYNQSKEFSSIQWNNRSLIINGTESGWESESIESPSVVNISGGISISGTDYYYLMVYRGQNKSSIQEIGLAYSVDGYEWVKYPNNPVLKINETWEGTKISPLGVLYEDGNLHLWYEGGSGAGIGYANSTTNGTTWTKYPSNPVFSPGTGDVWDNYGIGEGDVIRLDNEYLMIYKGFGSGGSPGAQLGFARSTDKITWTRDSNNPVYTNNSEFGEFSDLRHAHIVEYNGRYYVSYTDSTVNDFYLMSTKNISANVTRDWLHYGTVLEKGTYTWDKLWITAIDMIVENDLLRIYHEAGNVYTGNAQIAYAETNLSSDRLRTNNNFSVNFTEGDKNINIICDAENSSLLEITSPISVALCSGATFSIIPTSHNATGVTPSTQNDTMCTLNVTNVFTSSASFRLATKQALTDYKTFIIETFYKMYQWKYNVQEETDNLTSATMKCMDFQPYQLNTTENPMGRLKYDFDFIKVKEQYNGSAWLDTNVTFNDCNLSDNYVFINRTTNSQLLYYNITNFNNLSVSYKSENITNNNFILSATNLSDFQVNSSSYVLNNTNFKTAYLDITPLGNEIKEVRLYVQYVDFNTSTAYFDDLMLNGTTNSIEMVLKVNTENNYTTAIALNTTLQNITSVGGNSSQGLWFWMDFLSPQYGQFLTLEYDTII